jgi:hypothetical protein
VFIYYYSSKCKAMEINLIPVMYEG